MNFDLPTARLDIDLRAILHNYRALQARAGGAEVAPVVKADAYGLGMSEIAPFLGFHGARTFFVARLEEGIALRKCVASETVIYVLDGLGDDQEAIFTGLNLRPVLNSAAQYQRWIHAAGRLDAALHIDTGMNRLGVQPDEISGLTHAVDRKLSLILSHLVCGDEPGHPLNAQQLIAFEAAASAFPDVPRSLANSAGTYLGDAFPFDLVRPGISLYGGGPFGTAHSDIKPVAQLSARIMQVRDLKRGESVGYGASFIAHKDMKLATVGMGYADGLMRSFAANGFVTAKNQRCLVTGRISMDVFSIDVSGLEVSPDDWVEVIGSQQNLDEVAAASGTIGYEWLTRLGARIPRHYSG